VNVTFFVSCTHTAAVVHTHTHTHTQSTRLPPWRLHVQLSPAPPKQPSAGQVLGLSLGLGPKSLALWIIAYALLCHKELPQCQ